MWLFKTCSKPIKKKYAWLNYWLFFISYRILKINLEKSIRPQQTDTVRSYKWTETNPNDLIIEFYDGSRKYIKITKRSTELDDKLGTISSSEFQRLTQDSREGIPIITARRIINKWKPIGVNLENEVIKIEGLELVYEMRDGGDPLSFSTSQQQQQPKLLSKSKLILDRIQWIMKEKAFFNLSFFIFTFQLFVKRI